MLKLIVACQIKNSKDEFVGKTRFQQFWKELSAGFGKFNLKIDTLSEPNKPNFKALKECFMGKG